MKKVVLTIAAIMAFSAISFAQAPEVAKVKKATATVSTDGNYVAIPATKAAAFTDTITGKTYTDAKGVVSPVFKSKSGKLYIGMTSKKTGNYYRKYLNI